MDLLASERYIIHLVVYLQRKRLKRRSSKGWGRPERHFQTWKGAHKRNEAPFGTANMHHLGRGKPRANATPWCFEHVWTHIHNSILYMYIYTYIYMTFICFDWHITRMVGLYWINWVFQFLWVSCRFSNGCAQCCALFYYVFSSCSTMLNVIVNSSWKKCPLLFSWLGTPDVCNR